jgi:alpha-D-xyloside xylohydrolase
MPDFRVLLAMFVSLVLLSALRIPAETIGEPARVPDGVIVPVGSNLLKLQVCADDIIRVACAPNRAFFERQSLAIPESHYSKNWNAEVGASEVTLSTSKLIAKVSRATGAVSFFDAHGNPVLVEKAGSRALQPVIVQGDQTFHVRQEWQSESIEALYGLGQHQLGLMDIKGYDLDLWQFNGTIAIPFLVSSRGYGIFWDNTSLTRFGDLREWNRFLPRNCLTLTGNLAV